MNFASNTDNVQSARTIKVNQDAGFDMRSHMLRSGNDADAAVISSSSTACSVKSNKPKNHLNSHRRVLKEIQQKRQDEKQDARQRVEIAKNTRERLKPQKVRNATSTILSKGFLPAKNETIFTMDGVDTSTIGNFHVTGSDDMTTLASCTTGAGTAVSRNFLQENRSVASRQSSCAGMSTAATKVTEPKYKDKPRHSAFGKVPSYLQNRKAEWLEKELLDKEALEKEQSGVPPGHVLMEEEDRLQMLKTLSVKMDDVLYQLRRLPIARRTASIEAKRERLESELGETEEAIETFSKEKVYVLLDSNDNENSEDVVLC
jgi:hypothetical protein